MTHDESAKKRQDHCPVYDIECPAGSEAATSCEARFEGDYNPLTSFRDADIEHCAIYRKEQDEAQNSEASKNLNSSEDGEK